MFGEGGPGESSSRLKCCMLVGDRAGGVQGDGGARGVCGGRVGGFERSLRTTFRRFR